MQKITMQDLAEIHCLSQVACSPDAKHVAFVVTKPSIEKNCYCSNIWVLETESGSCRKLTGGDKESDFLWLDNERLLFSGDRKQQHKPQPGQNVTVYNCINIHGGEAEEFFVLPKKAKGLYRVNDHEFC